MEHLFPILLTTVLLATILNILFRKVAIPTAIGYIFAGTAISYIFDLGHQPGTALEHLAEFGIVLLMFTIGLEFSVRHLKAMKREVFLYGFLQLMLAGTLFLILAYTLFDIPLKSAIIAGFALGLSSTAIVLKLLTERNEIHSGFGRVVLGILLFQDIAVIPILLMISLFSSEQSSIGSLLLWTVVDVVILLLTIFVVGKYMLEHFLGWVLSSNSEEIFLVSTLMLVGAAAFFAHTMGFSYSLGAFLAGMTLAETRYKYRIEADLIYFRDIFLGIFFVTIGMQVNLETIALYWFWIIALVAGIMATKALLLFGTLRFFLPQRTSLKSALALMQVGEFALAIFALATQNHLLDPRINQILIVTVVITMVATPFIITNLKKLADLLFREEMPQELDITSTGCHNHVIVCGYGPLGQKICRHLHALSLPYLIIEHDHQLVQLAEEHNEPVMFGNAMERSILRAAGIQHAQAIIVAIENVAKTRMVVDAVKSEAPKVHTIVKVQNESHRKIIAGFGVDCIVNANEVVAEAMIKKLQTCILPNG